MVVAVLVLVLVLVVVLVLVLVPVLVVEVVAEVVEAAAAVAIAMKALVEVSILAIVAFTFSELRHNNLSKAEIVVLCMNIKMSRKLKRDMRHFSAYKALDKTVNSHRKLESSISGLPLTKIIATDYNSTTER